jgi:hypothetical protein
LQLCQIFSFFCNFAFLRFLQLCQFFALLAALPNFLRFLATLPIFLRFSVDPFYVHFPKTRSRHGEPSPFQASTSSASTRTAANGSPELSW